MSFDSILQRYFPDERWDVEQGHSGWNNTTRFVRADGRRWVLRIYETHKDEEKIRFEHRLLKKLNEVNLSFRVPRPIASGDGSTIVRLEDGTERLACLFAYIEGERPAEGEVAAAESLGGATGELVHALAALELPGAPAYAPYYEMESSYAWCTPVKVAEFCEEPPAELREEAAALRLIGEELTAFRAYLPRFRSLPHQLIHGDINFSNCLTREDGAGAIGAILDFEFCTRDLRAMEIAVVVSGFLDAHNGPELIEAFLRGAGRRLRLSREEAEAIPGLIRLRTLDVFLHFLNRYFDGVDGMGTLREQTASAARNLLKLSEESERLASKVEKYLMS
ncbi:phosphotransferase [Cohnella hongkongensis]|uniref:Phosphotransferase n=1 Tax=Cohnella hongkongensis TaxID=178337 RepID=A0ABV9FAG2_9BACL